MDAPDSTLIPTGGPTLSPSVLLILLGAVVVVFLLRRA